MPWQFAKVWVSPRGQRTKREYNFEGTAIGRDWKILNVAERLTGGGDQEWVQVKFGVPWSISEFFAKALLVDYPFQFNGVDDEVATAIFHILTKGRSWAKCQRTGWMERWTLKRL